MPCKSFNGTKVSARWTNKRPFYSSYGIPRQFKNKHFLYIYSYICCKDNSPSTFLLKWLLAIQDLGGKLHPEWDMITSRLAHSYLPPLSTYFLWHCSTFLIFAPSVAKRLSGKPKPTQIHQKRSGIGRFFILPFITSVLPVIFLDSETHGRIGISHPTSGNKGMKNWKLVWPVWLGIEGKSWEVQKEQKNY